MRCIKAFTTTKLEKLTGKGWEGFVFSGLVNSVRCHWAAPALESSWCSWDCPAPGLKLLGSTGDSGKLFHLHLSGFTSNFLSYLYPQENILFVHFLKENLFLHQFHIQFFGWIGLKHYTCAGRETSLFLVGCGIFQVLPAAVAWWFVHLKSEVRGGGWLHTGRCSALGQGPGTVSAVPPLDPGELGCWGCITCTHSFRAPGFKSQEL